jgi:hypothetical protein
LVFSPRLSISYFSFQFCTSALFFYLYHNHRKKKNKPHVVAKEQEKDDRILLFSLNKKMQPRNAKNDHFTFSVAMQRLTVATN